MRQQRILGLIPAKGGSIRLPRKNVRSLNGKPLLLWAGDALLKSKICDRIVVSTEDKEVADIARQGKLDVPFLRPPELARDPAGVVDVALHCLDTLKAQGEEYDTLIITLPSSPFRTWEDIISAYEIFLKQQAKFLMSVSLYDHTPFAAMKMESGTLTPWFEEHFGKKSQEMPIAYRPNGALHILDVVEFQAKRSYFSPPLYAYEMPWPRGLDIDTLMDFELAEALMRTRILS